MSNEVVPSEAGTPSENRGAKNRGANKPGAKNPGGTPAADPGNPADSGTGMSGTSETAKQGNHGERLSVFEKVGYGLGDTASNLFWKTFEFFSSTSTRMFLV
ncbi:hypothetical protein [Rhodopirellula sallentina]|nr:hypothetical protein [Rhodopirellula sallentina]